MATWPVAVPMSGALVSGDARDDRAPHVAAGTPLSNCTNRAIAEEANRKRLREEDSLIVTAEEVCESRRRRVALETCEAQMMHGMGNGAILAAVQANQNAIQAIRADIQANQAASQVAIQAILASIQANQNAIQANQAATQAAIQNLRRRELNRGGTWTHLLVENPGNNLVGVAPADHPASREAVFRMTAAQITALENAFNLPAGRFDGIDLAARRNAVLAYLCDGL